MLNEHYRFTRDRQWLTQTAPALITACDFITRHGRKQRDETIYFNASFLIRPDGELAARYCKRNLVIFGEYVPLVRWLPFVKWLTPIDGGFEPGDQTVPFAMDRWSERPREPVSPQPDGSLAASPHPTVRTATLICFEDVFPHRVRDYVNADTDFLVNLTNDGWFGEGGEQWQHAANAVFRAVENGVVRQVFRDATGGVHEAGVMTAQIPLLAPGEKRELTFYNRHGDWFGWGCVAASILVLLPRLPRRFRRK